MRFVHCDREQFFIEGNIGYPFGTRVWIPSCQRNFDPVHARVNLRSNRGAQFVGVPKLPRERNVRPMMSDPGSRRVQVRGTYRA